MLNRRIEPGSPEWHERRATILALESQEPMRWFYLSFAEPGKFLGGVYVEARGFTSAIKRSHELGINPGGEVAGTDCGSIPREIFEAKIPEDRRNRLLTKAEIESPPPAVD